MNSAAAVSLQEKGFGQKVRFNVLLVTKQVQQQQQQQQGLSQRPFQTFDFSC